MSKKVAKTINEIKDRVQREAKDSIYNNNGRSLITMATGSGKSRVPLLYLAEKQYTNIALIVPTEDLRDVNWKEEYDNWGMTEYWSNTTKLCYASASKISNMTFDLVIMDEAHNITELAYEFFTNNSIKDIVALTATKPNEEHKIAILHKLKLANTYDLPLEKAEELGIVAPFDLDIVYCQLNDTDKTITAGNKDKPFLQTEKAAYNYLTTQINILPSSKRKEMLIFKRLRFLYDLTSKTDVADIILAKLNMTKLRVLAFCGSINQAEKLCDSYYHSKSGNEHLEAFMNEEIKMLSCVKALNEGKNIPKLDIGLIVSFDSKDRNITQRIGRIIRVRPDFKGKIIIICCRGTQDEVWLEKALINVNPDRITKYNSVEEYLPELQKNYIN